MNLGKRDEPALLGTFARSSYINFGTKEYAPTSLDVLTGWAPTHQALYVAVTARVFRPA